MSHKELANQNQNERVSDQLTVNKNLSQVIKKEIVKLKKGRRYSVQGIR